MLRPLSLALALALPVAAQDYFDPTNVLRSNTTLSDVFVLNGKAYAMLVGTSWVGVQIDYEGQRGRLDVELIPRSIFALDSRPCARDGETSLSWDALPQFGMPTTGTLWWAGNDHWPIRGEPRGGRPIPLQFTLSYGGFTKCYTNCVNICGPQLLAVLCEVRLR